MDLKRMGEQLTGLLSDKDKRVRLIVALGILGMALIFFSTLSNPRQEPQQAMAEASLDEYAVSVEGKLYDIISEVRGVGRLKIMVTIESGTEYVYAQAKRVTTDKSQDLNSEASGRIQQKENIEQSYVMVENQNGRKEALIETQLQPKIQGVVIICEGADDPRVEQRIINVVTTALNIPSTKVCVAQIN